MTRKLISLLMVFAMAFTLVACSRPVAPPVTTTPEQGGLNPNWKIGVMTGTAGGQGEEEFMAGARMVEKYGADRVVHVTYPENFTTEQDTTIARAMQLANDPDVMAIVWTQAILGASAALDKVREVRPDILVVCGTIGEDPSVIADRADVILGGDGIRQGERMVRQAHAMGAKTFVHYSFPRHLGINTIAMRREIMMDLCEELGLKWVDVTAPDPTGDQGVSGAQQFITEDVPRQIDQYGIDTALYSTNCGMQEPLIREIANRGAIYPQQCCPSPYHAYPGALGISVVGHEGDVPYMLDQITQKIATLGNSGRMGTWPVPMNVMFIEGGTEYAYRWVTGLFEDKCDESQVNAVLSESARFYGGPDVNVTMRKFDETLADGTVRVYDNNFVILCDYYVF